MPKKRPARKRKPKPAPIVVAQPVVVPQPSATITTTTTARIGPNPVHRMVETFAFAGGVLLLMVYMVVEILHAAGIRLGPGQVEHGFPFGTMIAAALLVAPKMVGRRTAGRAWNKLAGRNADDSGVTSEQQAG